MNKLQLFISWSVLAFLLVPVREVFSQEHEHGMVNFDVSCSDEAGESFTTGVALLHHMMYEQAESAFLTVAEADSGCAMAHWGVAMTVIHPLWGERPEDEALMKGQQAVEKAKALQPPTEREVAYIEAIEPFFKEWEQASYADQLAAFEEGFRQLHESYPEDIDAAAFYALGHLATAPKEDKIYAHQRRAGELLEGLYEREPEHPGLSHYIIHAYDNPELAERAIDVARNYDKIAPNVPHALHMPSHIFVRLGMWNEVIDWNKRSAEAALNQPVGDMTSGHYAHALDYMAYAYLQRGEDKKAMEVVGQIDGVDNHQPMLATAYALAAVHARYPLERGEWEQAAEIPVNPHGTFALERYPAAQSIIYFTRGLGAARSGEGDSAGKAIEELKKLETDLNDTGETYWATLTGAQRTAVEAWVAFAEEDNDQALALMREAADLEDSVDKHPVTPSHVLPARELLGDMLLKLNEPAAALEAYETSLAFSANRFNSLYGAGHAAELMGDIETAKTYYTTLIEHSATEEVERPAMTQARNFMASN